MTQTLNKILYVEDDDDPIEVMVGRDVMYVCHSVVALLILIRFRIYQWGHRRDGTS